MIYTLQRVSGPEIEVFTLDQMKTYLRMFMEASGEDEDIAELIKAAREWVEHYTGHVLVDSVWRLTIIGPSLAGNIVSGITPSRPGYYSGALSMTPLGEVMLRRTPVLAVVSAKSVDASGTSTVLASSGYELREATSRWPRVFPLNYALWFTGGVMGGDLVIDFRAGYADRDSSPQQGAEAVPAVFKRAMKLWMEAQYDRDTKSMELMIKVAEGLLDPHVVNLGMA